ncbi:MAG: hypothetical protein QXG03_01375 [Halalkalicoccus sp.]
MISPVDETLLPYGWRREVVEDDRIAFTREKDRLTLVAEQTDGHSALTRLCTGPVWQLRCKQRAGEAESGISVGCVTTMDTAMETLLTYMRQITEAAETNEGISVGTVIELLKDGATPDEDEWGRTPSNHLGLRPPTQ